MIAVIQLISLVWAVITVPLAVVLLGVAVTWDGRAFSLAAVLVGFTPLMASFGKAPTRRRRLPITIAMAAGALAFSLVVIWRAPSGVAAQNSKVRHIYADGGSHFHRFALGNLLPEADQLMLGFTLMAFADSLFTRRQSAALKLWTAEIYRELEHDAEFHALGSVMPDVYDELWGWPFDRGHTFLYIPPAADRSKALPALIFLHGSGGNFKAYLWLLSQVADKLGMVVIAPSHGMGNWNRTDAETIVTAALLACSKTVQIDPDRLHVMGLSNGGLAASQLLGATGSRFRSFIFLSPVFDEARIRVLPRREPARQPPVYILTGKLDDRVPLNYVENTAKQLAADGARVTLERIDDADHFAFFSHRDRVLPAVEMWLLKNGVRR